MAIAGCYKPKGLSPIAGTINTNDLEGVSYFKVLKEPPIQIPSLF